ncbi:MAG: pyridoxal phosphate-dependent aminotransferase [Phycisphaerae bacterium]
MWQSGRIQAVQSPFIPTVAELIRSRSGTISLGQGVVYYPPPPEAMRYVDLFFQTPENHKYKLVEGIAELRRAIALKLGSENGIDAGEEGRIVVTAGGNMAFVNALLAVADAGDEIILQKPYYFNHEMTVTFADCKCVCVDTDESYQLRTDAIESAISDRTRAVVTISPNNPTGAVYSEDSLRQVNDICRRRGIYHIHDEAYEYFTYDGAEHFSPGSIEGSAGHTIGLYSLSKAYGFASWRIGWMVIPPELFDAVRKIQDTILICPPVVSQWAAVGAMKVGRDYCMRHREAIEQVRWITLDELSKLGSIAEVPRAEGALYLLIGVHTDMSAMELTERLIREYGVAVIPGDTFGMTDGCYLRVSYGSLERETAAEGLARLARGLRNIVKG